jgi:lipopolysaccharide export system protein LptA
MKSKLFFTLSSPPPLRILFLVQRGGVRFLRYLLMRGGVHLCPAVAGCAFVFASSAVAQNEDDRLRLLSADVARSIEQNGQVVRQLEGSVHFQQGAMRMSCLRAVQYVDAGRTEFIGKVEIDDADRKLLAERVIYNEKTKVQEAFENVRLRRGPNSLRAEKVTYFREQRRAIAEHKVELYNSERRIRVNGGRADYERATEYSRIIDNPVLVELDSLGAEIMRVVGDTMEVFEGGKRAKVKGEVRINRNKTRAECGEAEYFSDDERLELRISPVAWQSQDEIRGRLISLFFVEEKLTRAHVAEQANVVSKVDTLANDDRVNTLSGGEITMFFENDRVNKMLVERTATSFYHVIEDGKDKGRNRAQGDRITLQFDEGKIARVLVESRPGKSTGKFVPPSLPFDEAPRAAADSTNGRGR